VPKSRLGSQLAEATAALQQAGIEFALIGGLALAPHNVVRATQDVDLLVDQNQADAIEKLLVDLGYERLHRSDDAANYQRGSQRLDLLYAHRPTARRLLSQAATLTTPFGTLRTISAAFFFYAYAMVLINVFNGAGDTWTPTWVNLFSFWIFQIPLAWVLAQTMEMGPWGVHLAVLLGFSLEAVVAAVLFRRGKWKEQEV